MKSPAPLEFSSRLLTLITVTTLTLAGELHPLLAAPAMIAIGASLLLSLQASPLRRHPRLWRILTPLAFLAFLVDLLWLAQSVLQAAVRLLIYLMIYRLFHLDRPRAHLQLVLIAFLQMFAATQHSSGLFFGFSFPLFLLAGTWALILIHLDRQSSPGQAPAAQLTLGFFAVTTALALASFVFALAVFFVAPRASAGLFSKKDAEPVQVVGFSERIDFGAMGPIKKESGIVMRVTLPDYADLPPLPLYLRGTAFDRFDGRSWSSREAPQQELFRSEYGPFVLPQGPKRGFPVRYQILLEPLNTSVLFGFSSLSAVDGEMASLRIGPHGSVHLPAAPTSRLPYRADSRLIFAFPPDLEAEKIDYPDKILERYLQVPPGQSRAAALAREVTAPAITVYEKVKAVEAHLKYNYQYSLDVQPTPGRGVVEDFLFGQKTGYCEHFATAMVIMLRTLALPSRLVTGFLPGEWNEYGGYYMVRQGDAHSWVEVFFPESGWVTFDPTPPALSSQSPWLAGLARYLDHLQIRWDRYIIHYSLPDQINALTEIKSQTRLVLDALKESGEAVLKGMALLGGMLRAVPGNLWVFWILVAMAGALFLLGRTIARAIRPRAGHTEPGAQAGERSTQLYLAMLRLLESRGWEKPPHQTPMEFTGQLPLPEQDLKKIREITQVYYGCRFGGKTLFPDSEKKIEAQLRALRESTFHFAS